jgi:hypothetical protein
MVGAIVDRVGSAYRTNPLRRAYEEEVRQLATVAAQLRRQGLDVEAIARRMHAERRILGVRYKDATPEPLLAYLYEINRERYEDVYGPTFEWLLEQDRTAESIIQSALRPNADIDRLLSGFEQWLRSMDARQLRDSFGMWLLEA